MWQLNKMATALLGKKIGMTQIFTDDGTLVGVTAIEAGPCAVMTVRAATAQLGFDSVKETALSRPLQGVFKKLKISPRRFIREVVRDAAAELKVGDELKADVFKAGDMVDVSGISIGKGFQGGMKRWHWKGGPQTHGSTSHRRVGSIGSTTTPGRVWKGHHMPGHMGHVRVTVQNLKVVKVDVQNNLVLVRGAVPGAPNSYVIIRSAKKIRVRKAPTIVGRAAAKPAAKKGA